MTSKIPLETILIMPDPSQPQGTHRVRVASYATSNDDLLVCESLVTGQWVVMNEHGLVLLTNGTDHQWIPIGVGDG